MQAKITKRLFEMQDLEYREFHSRLMPNVSKEKIIGVRTPDLRKFAKSIASSKDASDFLETLPHQYYEEDNLHAALIIYGGYDYGQTLQHLERFLSHIDNWATCDMFIPPILKTEPDETLVRCKKWLSSSHPYTVRFGLNCLMHFYLDDYFDSSHFEWVDQIQKDDYYVRMGIAWYYSVALVKQWEAALSHLSKQSLDKWIHNKAIQKARESARISKTQKEILSKLKMK